MAAHVANITAVSSCKTVRGTSCCQHLVDPIKSLITKLLKKKCFVFACFCIILPTDSVSNNSVKKCCRLFHYRYNDVSVDKIKTNAGRQQFLKDTSIISLCFSIPVVVS